MPSEREIAFAQYWEGKEDRELTLDVVKDAYCAGWSDKPLAEKPKAEPTAPELIKKAADAIMAKFYISEHMATVSASTAIEIAAEYGYGQVAVAMHVSSNYRTGYLKGIDDAAKAMEGGDRLWREFVIGSLWDMLCRQGVDRIRSLGKPEKKG